MEHRDMELETKTQQRVHAAQHDDAISIDDEMHRHKIQKLHNYEDGDDVVHKHSHGDGDEENHGDDGPGNEDDGDHEGGSAINGDEDDAISIAEVHKNKIHKLQNEEVSDDIVHRDGHGDCDEENGSDVGHDDEGYGGEDDGEHESGADAINGDEDDTISIAEVHRNKIHKLQNEEDSDDIVHRDGHGDCDEENGSDVGHDDEDYGSEDYGEHESGADAVYTDEDRENYKDDGDDGYGDENIDDYENDSDDGYREEDEADDDDDDDEDDEDEDDSEYDEDEDDNDEDDGHDHECVGDYGFEDNGYDDHFRYVVRKISKHSFPQFKELPDKILPIIFNKLDLEQKVSTVPLVCKKWYKVWLSKRAMWRTVNFIPWQIVNSSELFVRIFDNVVERAGASLCELHFEFLDYDELLYVLKSVGHQLERLSVIGSDMTDRWAIQHAHMLPKCKYLDLAECYRLTNVGYQAFFQQCPLLTHLRVPHKHIRKHSMTTTMNGLNYEIVVRCIPGKGPLGTLKLKDKTRVLHRR